jgi:spore maturation protein CgeB
MDIARKHLEMINRRIRKLTNNFLKGQSIQMRFIYANVRNGGLGVPNMVNEYAACKINHMANLIWIEEGKKILMGYFDLNRIIVVN